MHLESPVFVHVDLMWCLDDSRSFGHAAERTLNMLLAKYEVIVVPTFTYSFYKSGKAFNSSDSPSEVGLFSEYARQRLHRTSHPMFSVASNIRIEVGTDSFGKGSIFDWLMREDGSILLMGCSFQACTFVHHIEQCYGVDYRHLQQFSGICDGERGIYTKYNRDPLRNPTTVLEPAQEYLEKRGTLQRDGPLLGGSARGIFDDITRLLSYDKYYLVRFET